MSSIPLETVRAEDYIEYFLFPDLKSSEKVPVEDVLQSVIQQINTIADGFCEKYIWHKDGFKVTPRYGNASLLIENQLDNCGVYCSANLFLLLCQLIILIDVKMFIVEDLPAHIYGVTHFEDNIQDEWFIVSLLFEITKQIPDIIVRVVDSDGEFILIEAAEHLPKWANPETCDQRVGLNFCMSHYF